MPVQYNPLSWSQLGLSEKYLPAIANREITDRTSDACASFVPVTIRFVIFTLAMVSMISTLDPVLLLLTFRPSIFKYLAGDMNVIGISSMKTVISPPMPSAVCKIPELAMLIIALPEYTLLISTEFISKLCKVFFIR